MSSKHRTIEEPPTSSAATAETEPEVVAAIASAEGNPELPSSFHVDGRDFGYARGLLLLAAGLAVGYGVARWLKRR